MKTTTSHTADVADRVSCILAAQLHVTDDRIAESRSLDDDLGATSLDMVEMIMSLEDEFGIEISDRDSERVRTVGTFWRSSRAECIETGTEIAGPPASYSPGRMTKRKAA